MDDMLILETVVVTSVKTTVIAKEIKNPDGVINAQIFSGQLDSYFLRTSTTTTNSKLNMGSSWMHMIGEVRIESPELIAELEHKYLEKLKQLRKFNTEL